MASIIPTPHHKLPGGSAPVLLVEDDPALREALKVTLELENIAHRSVDSAESALEDLASFRPAVVVSDIRLPGISGLDLLIQARLLHLDLPIVLMTAFADARMAVEALRAGARDFLLKPFQPQQLIEVIRRYLPNPEEPALHPREPAFAWKGPVAVDPVSRSLMRKLERISQADATVLLLGESGSGKEVMAHFLHERSPRAKQAFVAINCAAIPATLLESTLFGVERGAFTGAAKSQPGKFEIAQGGCLFLDEIGEMPPELQAKLLRVLQERQLERVGSHQTVELNVRVIAATNQDLSARVAKGLFREDLFYRLNVLPLRIPALRERPADILALAERFLLKYRASMGRAEARLSEASRQTLLAYNWPGNVRELENAIQRGLLLCDGVWIHPEDMDLESGSISPDRFEAVPADSVHGANRLQAHMVRTADVAPGDMAADRADSLSVAEQTWAGQAQARRTSATLSPSECPPPEVSIPQAQGHPSAELRDVEREHILRVLRDAGGNRKRAVEVLGMSDRTLRHKLKIWREAGVEIP